MFKKLSLLMKSWFGAKAPADAAEVAHPKGEAGLLGFALGKRVNLQTAGIMWLGDEQLIDDCPEDMLIEAHSYLCLGNGENIERFYATDDAFIQIQYTGRACDDNIEEILLYVYDKSTNCTDAATVGRKQEQMRRATFDYRGKTFTRVFEKDHAGTAQLVELDESVENRAGEQYDVFNHLMSFERELSDGTRELLLVTLEDHGDGNVTQSIAIGREIQATDLTVSLATSK